MGMVTVYRWRKYDVALDEHVTSKRLGTREGVQRLDGEIIPGSAVEVPEEVIGQEVEGMTARDYNPLVEPGFQRTIRS